MNRWFDLPVNVLCVRELFRYEVTKGFGVFNILESSTTYRYTFGLAMAVQFCGSVRMQTDFAVL